MKDKILVVGGYGHVGQHACRELALAIASRSCSMNMTQAKAPKPPIVRFKQAVLGVAGATWSPTHQRPKCHIHACALCPAWHRNCRSSSFRRIGPSAGRSIPTARYFT